MSVALEGREPLSSNPLMLPAGVGMKDEGRRRGMRRCEGEEKRRENERDYLKGGGQRGRRCSYFERERNNDGIK